MTIIKILFIEFYYISYYVLTENLEKLEISFITLIFYLSKRTRFSYTFVKHII
jgi:hypothetical protein